MKLLTEIHGSDVGVEGKNTIYTLRREAARAVVFDAENRVAVLHVRDGDFWKIPGGGIEEGEEMAEALKREVGEEAGVEIVIEKEIGMIIEHRDDWKQIQTSYCFLARVIGNKQHPKFDTWEKEQGYALHWFSYEEALQKFQEHLPKTYGGKFMQRRDRIFLENGKNTY